MKRPVLIFLLIAMLCCLTLGLQFTKKPIYLINEYDYTITVHISPDGGTHWNRHVEMGGPTTTPFKLAILDDPDAGFNCPLEPVVFNDPTRYEVRYLIRAESSPGEVLFFHAYSYDELEAQQFTVRIGPQSG